MFDEKLVTMMTKALLLKRVSAMMADSMPEAAQGHDKAQSVRVELGKHGELTRVVIASDWKGRLGSRPLGEAVMEALTAGYATRTTAMSSHSIRFVPPTVTREEAIRALEEQAAGVASEAGDPVNPVDLAEQFLARGDSASAHSPGDTEASSPVSVTVSAGMIRSVTIDRKWAAKQPANAISAAVLTAAEQNYEAAPDPLAGMLQSALASIAQAR